MQIVYHLARDQAWREAQPAGLYRGSPEDRRDGFLHFSTADQIVESAARHKAGEADLVLLAVAAGPLGAALRWEPSRGGALFPHLYGDLPVESVLWAKPLALGPEGLHVFPPLD